MRILRPALLPKAVIWGDDSGPLVAPGTYTVRVKLGDETPDPDVRGRAPSGHRRDAPKT